MTDINAVYLDRLYHFLRASPNILAAIRVFVAGFQDHRNAVDFFSSGWDIDTLEDALLDKAGQLIGVRRPLAQEDPKNIFTLDGAGETDDPDNDHGFYDDTDPAVTTGGYLTGEEGLESITDPGAEASNEYYRFLIKQKAASYRRKPNRENIFLYLIAFGARCVIDDDDTFVVEYDPINYYDLDEAQKHYITTRGFKPGCINISFRENMRNEEPI